ncbi:bifunctional diguanylate cyclase/phosphodiesterase [Nocardia sp. CDC159]|uniref:Bifunctional diguanylate cyclase/phosphodiesterase n=1 Tax=Nocardia pulmonis TaxID=2951408 RepID=A0A9X2ECS6_9NOCA|nr:MULTISPECIES: bifunctional diguanylate cyclase/phosphodiesterase [Nocardia]MCM6776883.1 bifunctional diguanylate cyclase/phosphodiesterase [Nocardia pulmonis]MCM6789307.1 bifunctional diguanylate cyclase/phosphodiesterase [Nocardia sp. CDC159]
MRGIGSRGDTRTRVRAASALATAMVMARTTGAFYVMGGVLGLLITAVAPGNEGNRPLVGIAAATALVLGISLLIWGPRLPHSIHHGYVAVATVLVTVAVHWFPNTVGAISLAAFYVFIACDAAIFFAWQWVAAHVAFAVVLCLWVVPSRGLPWWSGMIPAGVTVGVGIVVGILTRMASDADIDVLTGLLNRRGFDRALNGAIAHATRTGQGLALVLVDLDRFQKINDHLGHRAGDAVLQRVADAWQKLLQPDQRLARYGGDAFALLLPNTTEQAAILLTEQLRAAVTTGCSAGVTSWQPGESGSLLVSRADVGLYRAKQAGRNRTVLESSRQLPLAVELREAIDSGALDVHYQPIVSLSEGGAKAVGVEALLRWSSSAQPDVTTEGLIRVAEEYDLISDLDELVLRRACADAARLQETFAQLDLTLNVNVSGLELAESDYAERVSGILADTGWPAEQLVLEVTESELAAESQTAIGNLNKLRERGVRIAIDDFGTGYSSLSRLATIPSDILKVDQSFVAAIRSDSPAPPLLGVIAALSKSLDLQVIAEGVETEYQAAVLTELGFALAQGYHYSDSHPVSALISDLNESRGLVGAGAPEREYSGNGWIPMDDPGRN